MTVAGLGCAEQPPAEAPPTGELSATIIGGGLDTTTRGVVSLALPEGASLVSFCSGTLLAPNLVLTARHCVAEIDSADGSSVECGTTRFGVSYPASSMRVSIEANVGSDGLAPYRVAEIWPSPGSDAVCGQDIALLLLSGAGVPASAATPIEPRLAQEIPTDDYFSAVGYGLQDYLDDSGATLGHRMRVDDARVYCVGGACQTDIIAGSEWIAESPVCPGDSGGPALDSDGRVAGVTSRGDTACTFGVYSSVFGWGDVIKQAALDAAIRGGYTPPAWAGDLPPDAGPPPTGGGAGGGGSGGMEPVAGNAPMPRPPGSGGMGSGGSGDGTPTVDPLGIACTTRCPGAYDCWSASGNPPGICVPRCSESAPACPEHYKCDTEARACVPSQFEGDGDPEPERPAPVDDGGCSMAAPASSEAAPWASAPLLSALGLLLALRRRRARG